MSPAEPKNAVEQYSYHARPTIILAPLLLLFGIWNRSNDKLMD